MTDVTADAAIADTSVNDTVAGDTITGGNDSVAGDTVAGDTVADAKVKDKPTDEYWAADWREKAANGDEKRLNQLKRYASPQAALDALAEAQKKISSGVIKQALPDKPTPEQLAQYRADNGIPETPDKYDLTLPDGLVIGANDKPMVDEFLKEMHQTNASPEQVKSALTAYYKIQQDFLTKMEDADQEFRTGSEDHLRAEWGDDFRRNMNLVANFRDSMPEDVQNIILGGRAPDGRMMSDHPVVLNWLATIAAEVNPVGAILPSGGQGGMDTLIAEKATLESKMGTKAYGQKERTRYTEIVEMEEKMQRRA